jgi:hypothetical protein
MFLGISELLNTVTKKETTVFLHLLFLLQEEIYEEQELQGGWHVLLDQIP